MFRVKLESGKPQKMFEKTKTFCPFKPSCDQHYFSKTKVTIGRYI